MIGTRKTDERELGELKVTTLQLPAMRGSRLRLKLMRMLLPIAGVLKRKDGKKIESIEDLMAVDFAEVVPALQGALATLDDAAHDQLALELLICTSVVRTDDSGKQIKFDLTSRQFIDTAFGSDVDAMWGAMRASIEVNVGGFFAGRDGNPSPEILTPSS